jgi:hypothetical protein
MLPQPNLFLRPAPWGVGPGPAKVHSVDAAVSAVEMWLAVTPDRAEYRAERERMLVLLHVLRRAAEDPHECDLQSAKLAIKGMVRFARIREARRATSYAHRRYLG